MNKYGLLGFPLSHSFSKKYFTEKFKVLDIGHSYSYDLYEIENVEFFKSVLANNTSLKGLNVTIPYKIQIMPFLTEIDEIAKEIGAVNVIKVEANGKLIGYNSDYYGFKKSLLNFMPNVLNVKALVLGNGGASKAIFLALKHLGIDFKVVTRKPQEGTVSYEESSKFLASHHLIINCSPVGTSPNIDQCPNIDYNAIGKDHFLFDLVYNPSTTLFMQKGLYKKAKACNGYDMLVNQAEKSWEIWNQD